MEEANLADSSGLIQSRVSLPTAQASARGDFAISSQQSIRTTASLDTNASLALPALADDIKAGKIKMRLEHDVTYAWHHLRAEVHNRKPCCKKLEPGESHTKVILNNVSGCAKSGELWALMGSSGAGKTTLLNSLNFRPTGSMKISGGRYVNGVPISREVISTISSYVEQDDLVVARMTVLEHLNFNAKLRFPSQVSAKTRKARVEEVMKELGLWHVKDNYIGSATSFKGISGGEMKRLSFATEILTDPNILFCDEPTSGLDSFMASTVVEVMKSMAERGKLIICTIHQPSSEIFAMFDHLYLLVEGRVAYSGPREGAVEYFAKYGYQCPETHNPADFLIRLLSIDPERIAECRTRADQLVAGYEASEMHQAIEEEATKKQMNNLKHNEILMMEEHHKTKYRSSYCSQVMAIAWRTWILFLRNPVLLGVRTTQAILLGFVVGSLFIDMGHMTNVQGAGSLSGMIYYMAMCAYFLPAYTSVSGIAEIVPLIRRENWKGLYHTSALFLGMMFMDLPYYMAFPWLYFPKVWWLCRLTGPVMRLVRHCLLLAILTQTGVGLGYLAACTTESTKMALIIVTFMFAPSVMFCSLLADSAGIPWFLRWVKSITILEYTGANMMIEQWEPVTDIYFTEPFVPELYGDGRGVLDYYGIDPSQYWINLYVAIALAVALRLIAYLVLKMKNTRA